MMPATRDPAARGTATLEAAAGPVVAVPAAPARFGILGPLEVYGGRDRRTPRAHKPRVLLAVLLARHDAAVSIDSLLYELWGESPPRTALKALRVYVSDLRRVIARLPADDAGPALVTREPGYRLDLGRAALDSVEFEALCGLGRRALEEGRLERASGCYRKALDQWRGAALMDVRSSPLLENAALCLEEARLSALEHWIDLEMRLGRHAEVVKDLRMLTGQYPLHEGAHGRLMLALYLSGRQSDALETYRRLRGALVGELGVEPGRKVRLLHRAILAADDRALGDWASWI